MQAAQDAPRKDGRIAHTHAGGRGRREDGGEGMGAIYVARSSEVAARMLGGEMMIMSARDSTLFSLNETASAIWQAADGRTPLSEIVERVLCAGYEVAPQEALQHAEELVRELAGRGILRISGEPIAEPAP